MKESRSSVCDTSVQSRGPRVAKKRDYRTLAAAAFIILVFFTGGGSRSDIQSLVALRPLAVIFLGIGLYYASHVQLHHVRAPLAILISLALLAILQLVPLPAGWWTNLPQRTLIANMDELIGVSGLRRPLSMDPGATWNTFFALLVPIAALALFAMLAPERQKTMLLLVIVGGWFSAAFGFLQAIGFRSLQLYDIAHFGFPAGLFANKNHQSVLLVWLMMAMSWLACDRAQDRLTSRSSVFLALGAILVLFPLVVLSGSRAGLLLLLPAIAVCTLLLSRTRAVRELIERSGRRRKLAIAGGVGLIGLPMLLVFGILAFSQRNTALSRLLASDVTGDARLAFLPQMRQMALDFLPFGSGWGSFEAAFHIYEPAETLSSRYMNEAHNDYLQMVIEGGVPAAVILAAGILWAATSITSLIRSGRTADVNFAIFAAGSYLIWGGASFVDYPLRTPLTATIVVVLTGYLSASNTRARIAARAESSS